MSHPNQKPRPKPVTRDDYRRDRNYWKSLATKRQQIIDALENREYQTQHHSANLRESHAYFKHELQKICPHNQTERIGQITRCRQCKKMLGHRPDEKRSETT